MTMRRNSRIARGLLAAVAGVGLIGIAPVSAMAGPVDQGSAIAPVGADADSGLLDPRTYSGAVEVATEAGGVVIDVEAGELIDRAAEIRDAVARGEDITAFSEARLMGSCGTWEMANATPGTYLRSLDGCAVFGYPGYLRTYEFTNQSDSAHVCVNARGYNSSGTEVWVAVGCRAPGYSAQNYNVPWGNVLAYTKTEGLSLAGLLGQYIWWD